MNKGENFVTLCEVRYAEKGSFMSVLSLIFKVKQILRYLGEEAKRSEASRWNESLLGFLKWIPMEFVKFAFGNWNACGHGRFLPKQSESHNSLRLPPGGSWHRRWLKEPACSFHFVAVNLREGKLSYSPSTASGPPPSQREAYGLRLGYVTLTLFQALTKGILREEKFWKTRQSEWGRRRHSYLWLTLRVGLQLTPKQFEGGKILKD